MEEENMEEEGLEKEEQEVGGRKRSREGGQTGGRRRRRKRKRRRKRGREEEGKHYRGLDSEWPPVSSLSRAAPKCVSQTEGRSQPGLCSRISGRAENWSERRRGEARRTQGAL